MNDSDFVFTDNSVEVKNLIKESAIAFLHEIGGEIRSLAQRNSRRDTSQTAGSYSYKVDDSNLVVYIGSDHPNAVWEEFGTGEYALNGDGRKGWWVYVKGSQSNGSQSHSKSYATLEQAKRAVAILRKKGLDAHCTQGKKPNRPLYKAFETTKPRVLKYAEKLFGKG